MKLLRVLIVLGIAAMIARELWVRLGGQQVAPALRQSREVPFDPAFLRLSPREIAALPLAMKWEMPMGSEFGALTYNAQPFRITRHLGDDLNGIGGYNSDLGDPVWNAADGQVVFCGFAGPGWGKVVITACKAPREDGSMELLQVVYAHLKDVEVRPGQRLARGGRIGSVGTAEGKYWAHLHFELRRGPWINPGTGYADAALNRISPEAYIARLAAGR
jgi:murein DD-endopeptidase MepM/ murein hydrolase activator NlpD